MNCRADPPSMSLQYLHATISRGGLPGRNPFIFSSRRRHTSCGRDWRSDVCSSDLVKENLLTRGSFYGLKGQVLEKAVQLAAEEAEVTEFLNRPYGQLSGGQRRRADLARALVNRPKDRKSVV